jgi:hypothetical protein
MRLQALRRAARRRRSTDARDAMDPALMRAAIALRWPAPAEMPPR